MISILYKNCHKSSSKGFGHGQKSGMSPRQQFIIAVMLSVLFGIGWGIGLLATEELGSIVIRDLFASLFVISTGFHGLLIFILHGMRSKEARKEWRTWFFKATRKDFSDFTSSTFGHTRHHRKISSSQAPYQSSTSRSTEKTDLSLSVTSPKTTFMHDPGTIKFNVMKHEDHDDDLNEEGYDKALEAEMETLFEKVDLGELEAQPVSTSPVMSATTSADQATDVIWDDPTAVTVAASEAGSVEPKKQTLEEDKLTEKVGDIHSGVQEATKRNGEEEKASQTTKSGIHGAKQNQKEQATPNKPKKSESNGDEASTTKGSTQAVTSDEDQVAPVLLASEHGLKL